MSIQSLQSFTTHTFLITVSDSYIDILLLSCTHAYHYQAAHYYFGSLPISFSIIKQLSFPFTFDISTITFLSLFFFCVASHLLHFHVTFFPFYVRFFNLHFIHPIITTFKYFSVDFEHIYLKFLSLNIIQNMAGTGFSFLPINNVCMYVCHLYRTPPYPFAEKVRNQILYYSNNISESHNVNSIDQLSALMCVIGYSFYQLKH